MSKAIQTLAILFGGKSAEHEVSVISAKNISSAIDEKRFRVVFIGVDYNGHWHHFPNREALLKCAQVDAEDCSSEFQFVSLVQKREGVFLAEESGQEIAKIDVLFPILHGPLGEDGALQGLSRLYNIPCVGSSTLGSAICMDKDITKKLLAEAGIEIIPFRTFLSHERGTIHFSELKESLGNPLFVKPANMGSSVGVHKVTSADELNAGLEDAFRYDQKVIIEKGIVGREIECAVLGNEQAKASLPGEIVSPDFYSYEAKYIDENISKLIAPVDLEPALTEKVQSLALKTYRVLNCRGMARVDFFLTEDKKLLVNEVNTLPGFTQISMFPKLWQASGIGYQDLITQLVDFAIAAHKKESQLKVTYT